MIFGGGLRLFRLFGINVYAHWSFAVLLGLIAFQHYSAAPAGGEISAAVHGVGLMLAVFTCVVMHEFGHALAARHYGIKTRDIIIQIIGGVARLEGSPRTPTQELVVAVAGPLVNVGIVCILLPAVVIIGGYEMMTKASVSGGEFLTQLLWANVILIVFNMIPAFPMDGGRVLRALLWYATGALRATLIAARVGQTLSVGFIGFAIWAGTPMLAIVGVFVFLAAGGELAMARMRENARLELRRLDVLPAEAAMLTTFAVLDAGASVQDAIAIARQTGQRDFPVLDSTSGAVGMLHRGHLDAALRVSGPAAARDFAQGVPETSSRRDPLSKIAERMQAWQMPAIPVVEGGAIIGLVTLESLNRAAATIVPVPGGAHSA